MNLKNTIPRQKWVQLGMLAAVALLIGLLGYFPAAVEEYYSVGLYPPVASMLRIATRYIPFSLGDVIYIILCIRLIVKLVKVIILIVTNRYTREKWVRSFYNLLQLALWIYIVFKLFWGLNYNRLGIAHQLGGIDKRPYTKEEITSLTNQLIDKVNECRRLLPDTVLPQHPLEGIYAEAYNAYQSASVALPFLNYRNPSVKASLFTRLGDYMGFSGYYNPFTGEAQLRTDIPRVLIPFITCHEMAHQLGYASESEANFVGYLAASVSPDPYFRYSVYLDLFSYAQSEQVLLYGQGKDFKAFEAVIKQNRARLDTLVKKDRREIREFFNKRRNKISPAVSGLYDQYLKLNQQPEGIRSYDEVLGWLIAYRKKYGKL